MEILINSAILSPVRLPAPNLLNRRPVKATSLICCLRKNGEANGLFNTSSKLEVEGPDNAEMSQPSNFKSETKTNGIWQLFKEAQQNILYLNRQRLLAVEELNKANQEKEVLLGRIEQLEAEKESIVGKDKQSMCWELLLRIDSMVLSGMINAAEASDLRKAVMDYKFSVVDMFFDNVQKSDAELLAELHLFSYGSKKSGIHIVHICTEMAPVVEVGSLASYVTGLSCALQKKGHLVEVILPKYACLNLSEIQGLREIEAESYSYFNGQLHGNKIWTGVVNGIGVTFIQPLHYSSFFNREKIYGYSDDFERFSYFSRASLDYITKSGKQPDVLHIHNWETAIVGPLFWDIFVKQGLGGTRILLTCQNLDLQCFEPPDKLALCGLDPDRLHRPDRLQDGAKTQFVNILKGGIVYSNKVVIVSSIHSKSRIIRNLSHGLEPTLSTHRLLMIFCVINMLNYVDRGAIASNGVNGSNETCDDEGICSSGSGIQGDFNLNNFQDGVLSSAFMVGLLIASPIFASLAKTHNPFRLIGVGLSVWTFATAGCGSSIDFWSIAICRMLVGVGEASFISLAAPFIDDNAPAAQKTSWLAAFYMCIPTGVALGYVYGGFVGNHFNWRYAFWGEAFLMLPFAVFGFVMKPLQLKGVAPAESKQASTSIETVASITEEKSYEGISSQAIKASKLNDSLPVLHQLLGFLKDLKVLLLDKVFVINVLGYVSYNFVLGAYSYWGPKAGYNIYHMSNADTIFGGITIVCGILGTLGGGLILDRMNATISNAFKLLSGATFLGAMFCFSAFCLRSLFGFIVLFSVGELFVFATQAPVNYVSLHCVNPGMRPLSMAISTVSIHIFGDVPSSPLVGILQDHINNWRETALILTTVFFLAAGIWFIGVFFKSVDNDASTREKASMEPLLEENNAEVLHNFCEA